jgi:hypothetical protein
LPSPVRSARAPTRHPTQNPGLGMKSLHPSNNRHERILGRVAWRDTLMANRNRSEIPNLLFPALWSDQMALSGASRRKQIPSIQRFINLMSQSTELVPIGERFVETESCHLCNGKGEIAVDSKSKCSDCNGVGWRLNSESSPEVCATCAGHQKLITPKRLKCKKCDGRGFCVNLIQRFQSKKNCSTCSGNGHLNCKACNGTGVYRGLSRNSMGVVLTCTYCHLWKNRYAI